MSAAAAISGRVFESRSRASAPGRSPRDRHAAGGLHLEGLACGSQRRHPVAQAWITFCELIDEAPDAGHPERRRQRLQAVAPGHQRGPIAVNGDQAGSENIETGFRAWPFGDRLAGPSPEPCGESETAQRAKAQANYRDRQQSQRLGIQNQGTAP